MSRGPGEGLAQFTNRLSYLKTYIPFYNPFTPPFTIPRLTGGVKGVVTRGVTSDQGETLRLKLFVIFAGSGSMLVSQVEY